MTGLSRLWLLILVLVVVNLLALPNPRPAMGSHTIPPPVNDNFADARSIAAPLPYSDSITNINATLEGGEPAPCGTLYRTAWYSYKPSSDVVLTAFGASVARAFIAVYTGSSLATLTAVACKANLGPPELVVNATSGVTYYFQVGDTTPIGGTTAFVFSLHEPPAKGNDDSTAAVIIPALPYANKGDAAGATLEPSEPRPCANIDNTVWYSYTASADVILVADTEGATYDTALAVYSGGKAGLATLIGCDDNAGTFGLSRLAFRAAPGETYLFQVGGANQDRGHLAFNLALGLPPAKANDDFATAAVISEPLPYLTKQDTGGATMEADEPSPCAGPIASSLWYSYTPSTDVVLNAQSSGDFPVTLQIYRGTGIESLTTIGCLSSFIAGAGVTYYFQVAGCVALSCDGSTGNATFELSSSPCPMEGCIEMALNVVDGDCDFSRIPTECNVSAGDSFALAIDIINAPAEGYILAQSFIDFGSNLTYKPTENAIEELSWPDCVVKVRAQLSDESVLHGCTTGLFPPLLVSRFVGPFVRLALTCSRDASSTEVKLLGKHHPDAGTNGAIYELPNEVQLIPLVNHLIVNCGPEPIITPTPGRTVLPTGTATPSATSTPTVAPTQTAPSPGPTSLPPVGGPPASGASYRSLLLLLTASAVFLSTCVVALYAHRHRVFGR